jgi:type VI secretion system secreted protein VgrG
MSAALLEQVGAALGAFSSITRLYELKLEGDIAQDADLLLVEAFACDEQLQTPGARDVIVLSTSAQPALAPMLGKLATLQVSLVDGSRASFSGHVSEAVMLGSLAGLARWRWSDDTRPFMDGAPARSYSC